MRSSEMRSCASCSLVVYYALPSLARASQRLDMQSNAEGCMRRVLHYFYVTWLSVFVCVSFVRHRAASADRCTVGVRGGGA